MRLVELVVGEHVAGLHVLQLRHGAEIARAERVGPLVILALQRHQRAEPLLRMVARVVSVESAATVPE